MLEIILTLYMPAKAVIDRRSAQRSAANFCSTLCLLYATFCRPLSTDAALNVQQIPDTLNK